MSHEYRVPLSNQRPETKQLTDELTIQLDRKYKALRSGNRWAIQRITPEGNWDLEAAWDGGRRSLYHWMEQNNVTPSRDAEAQLALLPEGIGFKERT